MTLPWKNGFYRSIKDGEETGFLSISETKMTMEFGDMNMIFSLTFGEFENPDKRGLDATGAEIYNVKIHSEEHDETFHLVIGEGGDKFTSADGNIMEWVSNEYMEEVKNAHDPADNPQHNYKLQPDFQGRLIWISGASGMGKTTASKMLQEKEGYVFYEGDCFLFGLNPFVGSSPKGASYYGTKPLKEIPVERKEAAKRMLEEGYGKKLKGEDVPPEIWQNFYQMMCQDIKVQRGRIGGNWVVAQALYTKEARNTVAKELGRELTIYVLETDDPELQVERLCKRTVEDGSGSGEVTAEAKEAVREKTKEWAKGYDPVSEDEKQIIRILVSKETSSNDILEFIVNH